MLCAYKTRQGIIFPVAGKSFSHRSALAWPGYCTLLIATMSTFASAMSPEVDLQYPIGRFEWPAAVSREQLATWIAGIEKLPDELQAVVAALHPKQLDTPYRPGGWTVRQLVHHLADSHLNCYQRYRLALTEEAPVIKPYDEKAWAELSDAKTGPVDISLLLLRTLHARWTSLLHSLTATEWARVFVHPERGAMRLDMTTGLYAWHSLHHVAHIRKLREREGW
jgi:hypothetical protein